MGKRKRNQSGKATFARLGDEGDLIGLWTLRQYDRGAGWGAGEAIGWSFEHRGKRLVFQSVERFRVDGWPIDEIALGDEITPEALPLHATGSGGWYEVRFTYRASNPGAGLAIDARLLVNLRRRTLGVRENSSLVTEY